jgi:tetratricopeptide (TPR) repeat protein
MNNTIKNVWRSLGAGAVLIMLLTILAYLPALHCGFIWDDDDYVTGNPLLRSVDGLGKIWIEPSANPQYYPLVFTSLWVEYYLWKLQPFGYHLVNVLLHALNAVLLWRVLRQLKVPGAWWAAAIFALHPVTVESVAWVTERKNVLSGLFYLLAGLAYFRFRPLTDEDGADKRDWRFYPLVLVLFLCALLSKTVTCSLPAVLLLLVWWKRGRIEKRDVLALAPLFVLGAVLGSVTASIETHQLHASGEEWALSFVQRCLVAGRALWFYAGKLLWPRQLAFIYPRWEIDASVAWQYSFPLAALVVLIVLWLLRSRIGKGPLVAALFFAGTLVPALGFFNVYPFLFSYVADHFQYLACIGPITLVAGACAAICQRTGPRGRDLGTLAAAAVLLLLGVSTWQQTHVYQDVETLWRDTLTKNPKAWLAHNNWGVVLAQKGKLQEAMEHYEQALRFKPNYADAYYNLGNSLSQAGRIEDAIGRYEQALRIYPDHAEAHNNLGLALDRAGRPQEAMEHWEQALRIKPHMAEAHYNLGNSLSQLNKLEDAIGHYEQALRFKPDYAEAHYNLGIALAILGRAQEAIGHWQQELRIKPDDAEAHYNLGIVLAKTGRPDEAIGHYEQALQLKPDNADAHYRLALALKGRGRFEAAIAHYRKALELEPRPILAQNGLAWLLATCPEAAWRNGNQAVELAQQAVQLSEGKYPEILDTLAAAYAEAGRFPEAVTTAGQALHLADAQANAALAESIRDRLKLYETNSPYHEKP